MALLTSALIVLALVAGSTWSAYSSTAQNTGASFATASSYATTCPTATMNGGYLTGMEMGRRPFHASSLKPMSATGSADAAIKRTGAYSLKLGTNAAASYAQWSTPISPAPVAQVARFAFHLDSLPTANVNQLFGMNSSGGMQLRYIAATQKLAIALAPTTTSGLIVVEALDTVQAGVWYVIDVRLRVGGPNHIADWRINGTAQPSASVVGSASGTNVATFGTQSAETFSAHYDDIMLTFESADYPLGDGRVYAVYPDGMGTSVGATNFRDDDGTAIDAASWARLDEVPMAPITDYIQQTTASTTSYVELTMQNTTETCIRGARGYFTSHSPVSVSNKTNHMKISAFSGAQESIIYEGNTLSSSTTQSIDRSANVTPATTWSQSALNAIVLRFGYSNSLANGNPLVDGAMVEYEVPQ